MMLRHLYAWPRDLNNLVDCFWWPTFDMIIWGLTSAYFQSRGGETSFLSMVMGGLILWVVVYRSQQEMGIQFIKEAWDRNMLNIASSPLTTTEHHLALISLSMIKLCITLIWMGLLASLLFAFNIFHLGWALIPFAASLLLVGWAMGFLINGLIIRYGHRIESFAWMLIVMLMPFSGVFYPITILPTWMQAIARVLPTSYIFDGMRQVLQDGKINTASLVLAFALNGIYIVLAMVFYRYSYRKALETGMILKLG